MLTQSGSVMRPGYDDFVSTKRELDALFNTWKVLTAERQACLIIITQTCRVVMAMKHQLSRPPPARDTTHSLPLALPSALSR